MGSIRTWLQALLAVSSLFAGGAIAQTYDHSVYLDLDNNAATGCNVATAAGAVNGAEVRITATVTGAPPMVTGSTRAQCAGGVFGAAQPQSATYAVGLNNGINGADVIEIGTSLAGLGQGGPARLTFVSSDATGADQASGVLQLPGGGALSPMTPILVPATGLFALLALVGIVFLVARRHRAFASTAVLLLVVGAGVAWAANFVVDGQVGDWTGVAPLAMDGTNDATNADPRVEIVAVFAATESGNLFMRIDILDAQTPTNNAPVATDAAFSLAENSPATTAVGGVSASDANAGQTLTYAITAGNGSGAFAINAATGAITVANAAPLDFETTPQFVLTVTVTDNGVPVMSDTATITVNLTNTNEAPVLADAARAVAEDSPNGTVVGAPVVATDPDAGATFTYAITAGNTNGAFAISNTGQITVANAAEVANIGTFVLTVSVTDNGGLVDTATITVSVTDQNDAPVFTNEPYAFSLQENRPVGTVAGTVTSTDADAGQVVSYAITGGNTGGAFAVNAAGQITVANAAAIDFEANPSFSLTVTATDNGGVPLSDTATVTITLTDVNEAPTANDGAAAVSETAAVGTSVTTVVATDPDIDPPNPLSPNATLTFAITAGNTGNAFSIDPGTGVISTAAAVVLANSPYTLTVTVTDGGAPNLADTATITITVTDQNDAPVLNDAVFAIPENSANGSNVGTVTATDPDVGQAFTYSITAGNGAGGFAIDPATGQITVANSAALDFETTPSFVLTVNVADNGAPSLNDTAQVTINLANVNDPPVANDDTMTVAENTANGTLVDTYAATDPDGNTLTYAITGGTGMGVFAIDANTGAVTVANSAALNFEATPSFALTITVTDNGTGNLTDTAVVTINLTNVNEAPVANDASFSVLENSTNGTAVGSVTATDPDAGDTLSYAITAGNTNGAFAINAASGAITVANQAEIDFGTVFNLVVTVTDSGALTDTAAVTITVDDINEAPTAVQLSNSTVAENQPIGTVVGALTTTDPDAGNTHTYSLACATPGADDGAFSIAGNNLATAQPIDFETTPTLSICVRSTDGGGLFFDQPFTITVTNADDAPTAVADVATVAEDAASTPVDVLTNDTDPDAGPKTVNSVTQPANGTVTLLAGVVSYQPAPNYCNTPPGTTLDTFTYQLAPGGSSATVSVTVTCTNDAPVVTASAGATAFNEDGPPVIVDGGITVADIDSALLVSAQVSISTNFNTAQDVLAFTPSGGITGSYDSGTGILALSGSASPAQYQTVLQSVTYNNSSMNPAPATRAISFAVNDGALASNVAIKTVNVASSNDAPVVTTSGGATAITEDAAGVPVDAGLTVSDADDTNIESATVSVSTNFQPGDVLGFVNQSGITGVYVAGTGVLTLTGPSTVANYQVALQSVSFSTTNAAPSASKTIQFLANDGDVNSAPAFKALTVTGVNDSPVITTTAGSQGYTENGAPVAIDAGLTLVDPDSTNITSATVAITAGFDTAQDLLGFVNQSGISGSYNVGTGVLSLSGPATVAAYQAALASVTYSNSSEGPAPLARTISFTAIDDAAATSNTATRGIAITAVNDPPTAVNDTGTTNEDTVLNVPATGVLANDTDLDPGDTKTVVQLNGGALTGTSAQGGAVVMNANGSYTYTPAASFQALSTGQQGTDSFTYTMSDGGGLQSTATVNLTIDGVSDAPTAVTDTFDAIGNTALFLDMPRPANQAGKEITGSILANDTDPDTATANLFAEIVTNAATTQGGTITIEADGDFTYHPDDVDTGLTDTFTYRVCDATPCNSGTVANATGTINFVIAGQVWYVRNNEAAGGDGTSDTPFDTLVEAEAASGAGDTVYVFDGNDTSSNLNTGYIMEANERLIGEVAGLTLDPDGGGALPLVSLHPGTGGALPTLSASNEDVAVLASGVRVEGFNLDPSGAGGGFFGGAGVAAVTLVNVNVIDVGTAGTQAGLELNGTTGTQTINGFTFNNTAASSAAVGVSLTTPGTVVFDPASTVTVTAQGGRALEANGANFGTSQFDSITVGGSATGGVSLNNQSGSLTLQNLSLTTTSGATAAFQVSGASNIVIVPTAGTANVSATGGPAIDIAVTSIGATSEYSFDAVNSTNSAGDGINLDGLGTVGFTTTGGTIATAAGIAVDVNAGSGNVTLATAITNGSGASMEVTNRTAGLLDMTAAITDSNDAGGGITLTANGASTVRLRGGVALDTGATAAFSATGGGTVEVCDEPACSYPANGTLVNTLASTSGVPLTITSTTIGVGGVEFRSIAANGAPNGIVLATTGSNNGLKVSGTGGPGSGGTLQNIANRGASFVSSSDILLSSMNFTSTATSAGAPCGSAAVAGANTGCNAALHFDGVVDVTLANLQVSNSGQQGINGIGVMNFSLSGSTLQNLGNGPDEDGLHFHNLLGTVAITNTTINASGDDNVNIQNLSSTPSTIAFSGGTYSNGVLGSGLLFGSRTTANTTITVSGATIDNNFSGGIVADGFDTASLSVDASTTTITNNNDGVQVSANNGVSRFDVDNNDFVGNDFLTNTFLKAAFSTTGTLEGALRNNNPITVANGRTADAVMAFQAGGGALHALVGNNVINYGGTQRAILVQAGQDGAGAVNTTLTGNTIDVQLDGAGNAIAGMLLQAAITDPSGAGASLCADVGGAGALGNTFVHSLGGGMAGGDIRVRQRLNGTARLPGYGGAPTDTAAVIAYLSGRNTVISTPTATADSTGFAGGAACPQPTIP